MNSTVVNALMKRRAELAGDIEKLTKPSERWVVLDLESLDATASELEPLTTRDIGLRLISGGYLN